MFIFLISCLQPISKQRVNFISYPAVQHMYASDLCNLHFNSKFLTNSQFISKNKMINLYN